MWICGWILPILTLVAKNGGTFTHCATQILVAPTLIGSHAAEWVSRGAPFFVHRVTAFGIFYRICDRTSKAHRIVDGLSVFYDRRETKKTTQKLGGFVRLSQSFIV